MASVDVLQPFVENNDIFDAEMEDISEGAQNGDLDSLNENPKSPSKEETSFAKDDIFDDESSLQNSLDSNDNSQEAHGDPEFSKSVEESNTPAALDNDDLFDDERSPQNSSGSDNEVGEENETGKGGSSQRQRSPKPRRLKKAAIQSIHSECQKMLRESVVKLPYHQPHVKSITDFLKRVPTNKPRDNKPSKLKVFKHSSTDQDCDVISSTQPSEIATSGGKVTPPMLSNATDPFFLVETPTAKLPKKGIQNLMQRFAKHNTKPEVKSKKVVKIKETGANDNDKQIPDNHQSIILKEKIVKALPGQRLKILKEQLESKMKIQRAELRKIHESQRRLDNEEMSGEEEEEEEEEMTDEDSDYELDKWNEADEKKQEEGEEDNELVERKNDFLDQEADEDDNSKDSFDDINSGSEGDVSDEGNSDDDDNNSVFSDDQQFKLKKRHKVKKNKKTKQIIQRNQDERSLDLFNFNSNSQTGSDDSKTCIKDAEHPKDSENTDTGLCLRLDSIEEDEESPQNCIKTKDFKSPMSAKPTSVMEESSQSGLSFQMASDPEVTNESSRIEPAQGGGNSRPAGNEFETTEMLTMFPRISKHINGNQKNAEIQIKKAGKLSQLTLPIEDSQDLFYEESAEDNDEEKPQERVTVSNKFSFTLDEDTQFTQMLDTQGFLFSTSKQKSKPTGLFGESSETGTQGMEEIIGLCSGKFSRQEPLSITQAKKPHSLLGIAITEHKEDKRKSSNMDELLGLCTGQFSSDKSSDETNSRKFKPRSLLGTALQEESSTSSQRDELLDRCSGVFATDKKADSNTGTKSLNFHTTGTAEVKEAANSNINEEEIEDSELEREKEDNSDEGQDDECLNEEEEDSDVDIDAMRKSKKYKKSYGRVFNKKRFYEEEAELSGSDVGSDEDEDIDTDEDVLEEDSDQEALPSDAELQEQITKIHMKSLLDQDKAELRMVQDMYLADGDLHGEGRKRNFRWRGIDSNSQLDLFDNKIWNEDDQMHGNIELLTEEECKRRKERFERDNFLREEKSKGNQESIEDIDENSQVIWNIIKDTSHASPALTKPEDNPQEAKTNPAKPVPRLQRIPSRKGSFLNRSKATLSRLSSITANTPNTSSSGRMFVFKTVEAINKAENSKKMPRTVSMIEPSAKRPKLDRSLSETSNSIFAML